MVDLLYPFSVALLWGTLVLLVKAVRTSSMQGLGIGLLGGVLGLCVPFFFFAHAGALSPVTPRILLMVALAGITRYIAGTWCFYESIKMGDLSVSTPIIGFKIIIVSVLVVMLRVETITPLLVLAIILATAGFLSITLHVRFLEEIHRIHSIKSILFALAAASFWALGDIFVKKIEGVHPLTITFGSLCIALVVYYVWMGVSGKAGLVFTMPASDKIRYFIHGILSLGITYFLLNASLFKLGIARTNVIIAGWPLFASFFGYKRYKEKILFSKIAGAGLLIASFVLVAVS